MRTSAHPPRSKPGLGPGLLAVALLGLGCACKPAPPAADETPPSEARQMDSYRQPARLIAALALRKGDSVAEVGAGAGYLSLRLARAVGPSGRVIATDIDAAALAALRRRAAAARLPQIEARLVPKDQPSLEAGRYDLVFLAQVDHLVPDRCAYLRAILPALSAGGRVAISNSERYLDDLRACLKALPVTIAEVPVDLPNQFLLTLRPAEGR